VLNIHVVSFTQESCFFRKFYAFRNAFMFYAKNVFVCAEFMNCLYKERRVDGMQEISFW